MTVSASGGTAAAKNLCPARNAWALCFRNASSATAVAAASGIWILAWRDRKRGRRLKIVSGLNKTNITLTIQYHLIQLQIYLVQHLLVSLYAFQPFPANSKKVFLIQEYHPLLLALPFFQSY